MPRTRDEWTEIIFRELRGLVAYMDEPLRLLPPEKLMQAAKGAARELLETPERVDTHQALRMCSALFQLIREIQLENDTRPPGKALAVPASITDGGGIDCNVTTTGATG